LAQRRMVQRELPELAQGNFGSNRKPEGGAKGSAEHGRPGAHSLEAPPKPEGYGFEGKRRRATVSGFSYLLWQGFASRGQPTWHAAESVEVRIRGEFGAEGARDAKPSHDRRGFG
jgi:hypothetical protein